MTREEWYQLILDEAHLTEAHRNELKTKRGFTDDVIKMFNFKSSGSYLQATARLQNVPQDIGASLFYNNILIPYPTPSGTVQHMRPHKFGFKNAGIQPFIPYPLLMEKNRRIVLAESEFKAIASCLLGVPAIGIPGISSFCKTHLQELVDVLKALEVGEVVVCFDNEVKSDPSLPNYKADFTKRYDTQIYAYIMAKSLQDKGFQAKVATLQDNWRVQGKADIDGCLAQGINPQLYRNCIDDAISPAAYRHEWKYPKHHRGFVERKVDRHFYHGPLDENFKSYYGLDKKNHPRKITNFKITILHTLYSSAGAERYCRLESVYGNSSQTIVAPEVMVSKATFQKFCYELGDYEFYGSDSDLSQLWSYVIMHQDGRSIIKLKSYGFDEDSGIWFFRNAAYKAGVCYEVDEEGIVWAEEVGYLLPQAASKEEDKNNDRDNLISPSLDASDAATNLKEIAEHFGKIFDKNYSRMILGWALGNFFMPEILKHFKVYPFLFFYGKQQAGKSTLAGFVTSFFGFTQQGIPYFGSSAVGISRSTALLSMVPVWLEEYRNNDPKLAGKNNLLRSIYDKSTIVKGTKKEDEIKTYKARSTLIISGEEYPNDAALNSRCMLIPTHRHDYKKIESFDWMSRMAPTFNQIGHQMLLLKESLWPAIKKRIQEYANTFEENLPDADSRSRIHHAVLAGVVDQLVGRDEDFEKFLCANVMERTVNVDKSQAINVFYDDMVSMYGSNRLNQTTIVKRAIIKNKKGVKETKIAFWFTGAYSLWETTFKNHRNDIPASQSALFEHIRSEGYYIEIKPVRINNKVMRCMVLDEGHKDFPIALKYILASEDANDGENPWKPDSYDDISEVERPHHQDEIPFNDNLLSLGGRGHQGASSIREE